MTISNSTYDILKWIALVALPAVGTLYFALAGIWGFPYGEQVVGTITAVDTFLGVLLGVSNHQYNKNLEVATDGTLLIDTGSTDATLTQLEFHSPLEDILDKKTITFKIDAKQNLSEQV